MCCQSVTSCVSHMKCYHRCIKDWRATICKIYFNQIHTVFKHLYVKKVYSHTNSKKVCLYVPVRKIILCTPFFQLKKVEMDPMSRSNTSPHVGEKTEETSSLTRPTHLARHAQQIRQLFKRLFMRRNALP